MGKIPSDQPQKGNPPTTHCSHPHPLNPINSDSHQTLNPTAVCAGCKLKPSGMIYSCTTCSYFLHKNCFEMPKKVSHPFHKEHSFALLTQPAYAEGVFSCDACGEAGNGFSYHCKPCGIDLHILCAAMPLSVSHACHAHKLELAFENPYGFKLAYSCDICKNNSSSNWLYRCAPCGFDAHLNCARGVSPSSPPMQSGSSINFNAFPSQGPMPQPPATSFRSAPQPHLVHGVGPQFMPHQPMHQNAFPSPVMNHAAAYGVPVVGGGQVAPQFGANREYETILQTLQQMINNNNAMNQAILANSYGGLNRGSQYEQLMQLMSSFNNGGNSGVGGGIPGLNTFGGGAGQDLLQSLMNGGGAGGIGGGGLDMLQNLLGGGGGLDFLSGALGGLGLF